MEKFVSIIIPCYNDHEYVEQAVDSALSQTYLNKELIVIDDGSNKKTKKVLQKIKTKIDLLLTQENKGVVKARNNGIKASKGDYILTLDADDYFDPLFLEKAVKILDEKPSIGLVTCIGEIINKNEKSTLQTPSGAGKDKVIYYNNAFASLLFRKKCWQEVRGYDENMALGYEDWEFNISMAKAGWQVYVIKEKLFNYRNKINSRNKSISIKNNIELAKYVYKKHKELYIENYEETIDVLFDKIKDARMKSISKDTPFNFIDKLKNIIG
jgi:glycosyltransferase involved in cell wall biosynthesis